MAQATADQREALARKSQEVAEATEAHRVVSARLEEEKESARKLAAAFENAQLAHQEEQNAQECELVTLRDSLAAFKGSLQERARLEERVAQIDAEREKWLADIVTLQRERSVAQREAREKQGEALVAVEHARARVDEVAAERDALSMSVDALRRELEVTRGQAERARGLEGVLSGLEKALDDAKNPDAAYENSYPSTWREVPTFLAGRLGVHAVGLESALGPPFQGIVSPSSLRTSTFAESVTAILATSQELVRLRIARFGSAEEDAAAEVWRLETEWARRIQSLPDADALGIARVIRVPPISCKGYCIYRGHDGLDLGEWLTSRRTRGIECAVRAGTALASALERLARLGIACQGFSPSAIIVGRRGDLFLAEPATPEPEGFAAPEVRNTSQGLPLTMSHGQLERSYVFVVSIVTVALLMKRAVGERIGGLLPTSLAALMGLDKKARGAEIEEALSGRLDELARREGGVVDVPRLSQVLHFGASEDPDDRPATLQEWSRAVVGASGGGD